METATFNKKIEKIDYSIESCCFAYYNYNAR